MAESAFVADSGEALLLRLAREVGEDTSITNVDGSHTVFVILRHQQPGTQKTLTSPHISREFVQAVSMHLARMLACIRAGTVPFVEKMATRPRPGARAANTLQASGQWTRNANFPPCFNTQVVDATLLFGAYRSLDVLFFGAMKVESWHRIDEARAHLLRDVAEVLVHRAFAEFKPWFMNFRAHFGYTGPHPFPVDGNVVTDPAPSDALAGGGVLPPPPPQVVPGTVAEESAPQNRVCPIVDGDDATSSDASSFDVLSLTSFVVDIDSLDGFHNETVIDWPHCFTVSSRRPRPCSVPPSKCMACIYGAALLCFRVIRAWGWESVLLPAVEGNLGNCGVRQCLLCHATSLSYNTSSERSGYVARKKRLPDILLTAVKCAAK